MILKTEKTQMLFYESVDRKMYFFLYKNRRLHVVQRKSKTKLRSCPKFRKCPGAILDCRVWMNTIDDSEDELILCMFLIGIDLVYENNEYWAQLRETENYYVIFMTLVHFNEK